MATADAVAIATKRTQKTLKDGYLTKEETTVAISALEKSIKLEVSKTYLTIADGEEYKDAIKSEINQSAEQITLEVSTQLSGRNLLQYQNFEDKAAETAHTTLSDGVLTIKFAASETEIFNVQELADAALCNLARGKCITVSGYYKVIKPFKSAAARLSWRGRFTSGATQTLLYSQNAALKLDEVSADWIYYEKTYMTDLLDEEIAELGMMCEITPSKAGTDGEIQWKNWKLKISTPVQSGAVRSKFAMDAAAVTIDTGRLTFNSNTIVINSTNFKLDASGNVTASGTFKSVNDKWEATLHSGSLSMTYDGNQRVGIFKAANYDAGYLSLDGVFGGYTANAMLASDGFTYRKNGESIFSFSARDATLTLGKTKLMPCYNQNALYCNWVRVNGADGKTYWALCGFASYQGT